MRERRIALLIVAAGLMLTVAMRHPSADIQILTHDASDRAPARIQAAVDLGAFAISVMVTWTKRLV